MSYSDVVAGLHERFATVAALNHIQLGEPKAVQTTPLLYTLFSNYERRRQGQITTMRYTSLHRICYNWSEPTTAEQALVDTLNAVPAAVDADPTLGGRLTGDGMNYLGGIAEVIRADSGWAIVAGNKQRVVDIETLVIEKAAYQQGLI